MTISIEQQLGNFKRPNPLGSGRPAVQFCSLGKTKLSENVASHRGHCGSFPIVFSFRPADSSPLVDVSTNC